MTYKKMNLAELFLGKDWESKWYRKQPKKVQRRIPRLLVISLRRKGFTNNEIGELFDVSGSRISQIYFDYKIIGGKLRNFILKRDEQKCRICKTRRRLQVHHIDGDSHHNKESNLITLCTKCHCKEDAIVKYEVRKRERDRMNKNYPKVH